MRHELRSAVGRRVRIVERRRGWRRPETWFDRIDHIAAAAGVPPMARLPLIWLRRLRNRRELARLEAAQLNDVGLNPELISREAAKRFWQE